MRAVATIRLALRALRRNKLRSTLTMLGIIIGVGSVIASVSITTGATKEVESRVAALGQNVVTVFSGSFMSGGMRGGGGSDRSSDSVRLGSSASAESEDEAAPAE